MAIIKWITFIFLFPGDLVRRKIGMSVEEDGGILRSFINMCFWGAVLTLIALKFINLG